MDTPLVYKINPVERHVHVKYQAQPTFDQWESTMQEILHDPQYHAGFGFLLDRSHIWSPASTGYIHRLVDFAENHVAQSGGARWALLVVDFGSLGMARMAELLSLSAEIRAFLKFEEAKAWLAATDRN